MAASRRANRLISYLTMGLLVLIALYVLAGFLLVPWWLERALPEQLAERLGWQVEVDDVSFNPLTFTVGAEGLSAQDGDDTKVVSFERLGLDLNLVQLVSGTVGFEAIELQEPFVRLDLLEDYSVNFVRDWQRNNPAPEPPAGRSQTDDESAMPRLYFGQISINGGELLFRDFSKAEPAEFRISPLDLSLNDLASWPRDEQDSNDSLQAAIGDETIDWQGDLSLAPLYSKGTIKVSGIGFQTLEHFLAPYLPYDLRGGKVSLSSDYELQIGQRFLLVTRNGNLSLDELAIAVNKDSEEAELTSGTLSVDEISFDLNALAADMGQVTLDGLEIAVTRGQSGAIDWLAPFSDTAADSASETEAAGSGASSFRWSVAGISLSEGQLRWRDQQPETPADLALEQLSLSVGSLDHTLDEPVNYQAEATLASGGRLTLNGQLTPKPFTLEAAVSGSEIALAAFEPYVQEGANLSIASGTLGLDGNLDLDGQQEPLTGTFSGTAEVAGLAVQRRDQDSRLLSWQTLRLAPIEYNVAPARLEIGTVTLTGPQVNAVRSVNGSHNLARVFRSSPEETSEDDSDKDPGFIFRIKQLMLEQGEIAYTDRSIEPVFTTRFDQLSGSVTGLSNIPPQQGKVKISGRVGEVAKLDFSGNLGTLGTDDVSQMELAMTELSLPELGPYFGRYIGYQVDSGKLNLDLKYEITGTRLNGTNLVVMDRLELGEPVASDEAVDAPVSLGLALLRDRDGVIEVKLPISGDLSDPQFNISRVVMGAFVNLLAKAASSPFGMLGSIADLAGFNSNELGQVSFKPGSTELAEGEPAKLSALADALLDRPKLLLSVRGGVAPEADGLALLRKELTANGAKSLSEGDWQAARQAFLAGERTLPPEALNNLASARGRAVRTVLLDTHEVPADQLFMLDPSRQASLDESGAVTVQFSLDVR
ncbi:DUF748 domain-containing protein [Marinobacter alexandrii]|uniref:DUF748 domain-containing protein n=1 Tax=Marinobacter alexandrii TaxID=2570351 RepID=UPI001D18BF80|nr:DUF748 domain-containing protein [Marinobacter alexandrii]